MTGNAYELGSRVEKEGQMLSGSRVCSESWDIMGLRFVDFYLVLELGVLQLGFGAQH